MLLLAMTLTTAVINSDLLYGGALQRTDPSVSAHTKNHTKRQTDGGGHGRTDRPAISDLLSAIHASCHHRRQQQQQHAAPLSRLTPAVCFLNSNVICHLSATSNTHAANESTY